MAEYLIQDSTLTGIADAIRAKTGGLNTMTPAQMAEAVGSIETGTTPSGTLTITENGTYDVSDKAAAAVCVPTYQRWTANLQEQVSSTQAVTLITDPWIAEHYNDPNLELTVTCASRPNVSGGSVFFIQSRCRNTPFTSGGHFYQLGARAGNGNAYNIGQPYAPANASMNGRGMVGVFSTGEVKVRADSACVLAAGEYEIIARLL